MNLEDISIFVGISYIFLALFVIVRNYKSRINQSFFAFIFSCAIWIIIDYVTDKTTSLSGAYFLSKLSFVGPILIPFSFFIFTYFFPYQDTKFTKRKFIFFLIYPLILILLIPSSLYVKEVYFNPGDTLGAYVNFTPGNGYYLFVVYFLLYMGSGLVRLINRYRRLSGNHRLQISYLFFGTLLSGFIAIITNIFLPFVFEIDTLTKVGPASAILLITFTTYAIVKHHLLDIRLIILRTITYTITSIIIIGFVVGTTLFIPQQIKTQSLQLFITISISIFLVFILNPLKKAIAKLTDKIFFKASVDYRKLLTSLSEVINTEIDLDLLLYSMSRKLEHNLKVKNVSIYLEGASGGGFYKRKGQIDPKTGEKIEQKNEEENSVIDFEHRLGHNSNIVNYLKKAKDIVVLEALERKIEDTQDEKERKVLETSKLELDKLDASVVAPVTVGRSLTGIMVFGPKLSGDPYGSEDINLLQLIGPQLASALEKSRLYEDAKQFNERLKKEVAMATLHLRDANDQLQEANKHLQQLDTAKSEFVSITSHQLRTPMTGIMGYLSMILQGDFGKVPKEQDKILLELFEESQRMIRIINLFLNVSKIESGKMELNLEPVQIEEVVEKIISMVRQPADDKKIKLFYKKPSTPLPKVMADKDKLGDIVLNFTDNAIKYTEKGSVTLITEVDGNFMHFAVKDTGRGIESEEAKKLFTKFVRGFGIAQVNPDGSGLGLYVARRLTEAHHGEIWVDSEGVGKGSTFNVKIPLTTFNDIKKSKK